MRVRKRTTGTRAYFYLEHSVRVRGEVRKREVYLGRRLPRDLDKIKAQFLREIRMEQWRPVLDAIRRGYAEDVRRTPVSARDRNLEAFGVRFTYNTQRIEGSTLTLRETADLLDRGITPSERPLQDVKEAEAHREVFRALMRERKDLSLSLVLRWHHEVFRSTRPDIAGRVREHQVAISGSRFVPPSPVEVSPLLREFFRWYDRVKGALHPVELAALAHLKLVTVHPFSDGNGRIARLVMNFILHRRGFPMLDIPYQGRDAYYASLERAQLQGGEEPFVTWFLRQYVRGNRPFLPSKSRATGGPRRGS